MNAVVIMERVRSESDLIHSGNSILFDSLIWPAKELFIS